MTLAVIFLPFSYTHLDVYKRQILLGDVAEVRIGPQLRLGAAELDGEGEAVGGIIVMRSGENALTTIEGVKAKLEQLRRGLPEGVEIVEAYDRSNLILRAVRNLGCLLYTSRCV